MNFDCPLCSVNLQKKRLKTVPFPGELRWLALRWYLECPSCKGPLQQNQHPHEKNIIVWLGAGVGVLNLCALLVGLKASGFMVLAAFAVICIAPFALRRALVPKTWARYARHKESA